MLDGALEHTFTLPQLDDWSWTNRDGDRFYDVCVNTVVKVLVVVIWRSTYRQLD